MEVKAKLRVILQADDKTIAESENIQLWQDVLAAINRGTHLASSGTPPPASEDPLLITPPPGSTLNPQQSIQQFSDELKISTDELIGACRPSLEPPYIHLDPLYWEALKKETPKRGPNAVPPLILALTLLVLWQRHSTMELPTNFEGQAVLGTISMSDKNPGRGIRNCAWLQKRGRIISLNPAKISKALELARAYCLKQVPSFN